MNKLSSFLLGSIGGAMITATVIYLNVGHYREPEHMRNMGYLDAQADILDKLTSHFGAEGVLPGDTEVSVQRTKQSVEVFSLKTSTVCTAEKDGVPTLYVYP